MLVVVELAAVVGAEDELPLSVVVVVVSTSVRGATKLQELLFRFTALVEVVDVVGEDLERGFGWYSCCEGGDISDDVPLIPDVDKDPAVGMDDVNALGTKLATDEDVEDKTMPPIPPPPSRTPTVPLRLALTSAFPPPAAL